MKCPVCKSTDFKANDLHVEGFSEGIFECLTCGTIWALQHGLVEIIRDSQESSFRITSYNVCYTKLLRAVRYRNEENELDRSEWKQETVSPTLSFWYAPAQKLNLTFAYNYLGQRAESRFCQGSYNFV